MTRGKSRGRDQSFHGAIKPILFIVIYLLLSIPNSSNSQTVPKGSSGSEPPAVAQFNQQWQEMIKQGKHEEARRYCSSFQGAAALRVDALVCLGNVEINQGRKNMLRVDTLKMGLGPKEGGRIKIESEKQAHEYVSEEAQYDLEKVAKGIGYLDQALALDPKRVDVWQGEAFILQESGQHQKLLELITRAAKNCPGISPQDLNGYGADYMKKNRNQEALDVSRVISESFPQSFVARSDYGATLGQLGKLDQALAIMEQAVKMGQDDMVLTNLANLYIDLSRVAEALPYLKKMYEKNPDNPADQIRYLLATTAVNPQAAKRLAGELPPSKDQMVELIRGKVKKGMKPDDAFAGAMRFYEDQQYENVLLLALIAGDDPQADYVRAAVYDQQHYYRGVITALNRYLQHPQPERAKEKSALEVNLGRAYLTEGEFAEAETHLQNGIDAGNRDTETYYMLGRACELQGKVEAAIKAYQQAIAQNNNREYVGWSKYYLQGIQAASAPK